MSIHSLVVVESPSKAKTINKYLGSDDTVIASYGHVRDLPPKNGSVLPDDNFSMSWEISQTGKRQLDLIQNALKKADKLILATDPDREGEAISWHVLSVLKKRGALKNKSVERVTFNEITKSSIQKAMQSPRDLDQSMIDAYMARRALDYLVGFTLSPVLWRKLPGSRSAGRVQSVALRLICERESEIEDFDPQEYWSVEAVYETPKRESFKAKLTHLQGKKLNQFSLPDEESALKALKTVESISPFVRNIETKEVKRNPAPPFTTSTLQQEASRKLGMSATNTMKTAQSLYEGVSIGGETVGLITYMRTDGVSMAPEAMFSIINYIKAGMGDEYLPEKPRFWKTKSKNAQEAHECIRPTDIRRSPSKIGGYLNHEQRRLYELIWNRTVASQMASALLDQTTVTVGDKDDQTLLRATGTIITFDGFLRVYTEGRDDKKKDDGDNNLLPTMQPDDPLKTLEVIKTQHYTQPPPRYTEASLVKKMEEIGIGRPSTYASILGVLRDREYATLNGKTFIPEDRGRIVTSFLTMFFNQYVDTGFTAHLEEQLDDISGGRIDWHKVMKDFWNDFYTHIQKSGDLSITEVIDSLDEHLGNHFFPPREDGTDPRKCPTCGTGRLGLKLSKTGAFIGCSHYPDCKYTRPLIADNNPNSNEDYRLLGTDPITGKNVSVEKGPYGHYVQLGDTHSSDEKPKRSSLPSGKKHSDITLGEALALLSLPREIGIHPERGEMITAGLGRFGYFVKMGSIYGNLSKDDDVYTLTLERAVECLTKKLDSIRTIGIPPKSKDPITLRKGRFGPYLQWKKTIASIPKDRVDGDISLEEAISILKENGKPLKGKSKSRKRK